MMEFLPQHVECLIFAAPQPIPLDEIRGVLEETFGLAFTNDSVREAIGVLRRRYDHAQHSFEIVEIAGGYQFMSKGAYHQTIGTHLRQQSTKKLSRSALETLSIIAYRQPVTRSELEKIRGVSCDYALQKLLEKELVTITGRADSVGKPLLYGVTDRFMDYFGLKALTDLPHPKEFKLPESIGTPEDILVDASDTADGK
ncbi:Segregation and condensation protein B [Neolewinella maritima]|uniref:Segregation and condensation protein B n=1 Tax=Neolewinella maritima TaxID=1383882 RepID=A0ABM9B2K5_9BACT|nr:SMC-Scp complex subunit ScpB [Neolewinella maritima]CAH1001575.1 Segregation and condensation protein B [Neolewinella maritima]